MKTKIKMKKAYCSSSNPKSLANRFNTILRKAQQLSALCKIKVCVIYYGADGEWKTWPEKREEVEAMAKNYKEATKPKKCLNLREFLEKEKGKKKQNLKKKKKYPNLEHYSSQQLSQLIHFLERTLSTLEERLRFIEAQKQMNTNLIHQTQNPPSNFSMINYKHEETSLSPAAPLNSYQNDFQMYQEELYGFGQNNITNTNFQMQQQVLHGFDEDMSMRSDIINNYVLQHPYPSNMVPLPLSIDSRITFMVI